MPQREGHGIVARDENRLRDEQPLNREFGLRRGNDRDRSTQNRLGSIAGLNHQILLWAESNGDISTQSSAVS